MPIDDTPEIPVQPVVTSEPQVPDPVAVEEEQQRALLERLRAEEALSTLDRISRATGLRFESRRQQATEQFTRGLRNAVQERIPRATSKEEAQIEPPPKTPAPPVKEELEPELTQRETSTDAPGHSA